MFYVHQHRSLINAGSPIATVDGARQYVAACIAGLRRNGIGNPDAVWVIVDAAGNPVERIVERDQVAA